MITCIRCEKHVIPVKDQINWGWFVLWLVFGFGIGGVCYLLYFNSRQETFCPLCSQDIYGRVWHMGQVRQHDQP